MNTLIIALPPCQRHVADASTTSNGVPASAAHGADLAAPAEYVYVLTADKQSIVSEGQAALTSLPRADEVILVVDASDLSWHRLTLPKAPSARLRQALCGVLEEQLLSDTESLHFALAPDAKAGQLVWVAVCQHAWLSTHLKAFEGARIRVSRVVPTAWPDAPETGFFQERIGVDTADSQPSTQLMLTWATPEGIGSWPVVGSMARAILPDPLPSGTRLWATPAVVALAEGWMGQTVVSQTLAQKWLLASQSTWNLLQFDLVPKNKGMQTLAEYWRQFMGPGWRVTRWGLIALLITQVLCLNAWSWRQQHTLKTKRVEMNRLFKTTYPEIQSVLDPALQMRQATDLARAAGGQVGPQDFEFLMRALAEAWVGDQPAKVIVYDGSSLKVEMPDFWQDEEINACSEYLKKMGFKVEIEDPHLRFWVVGGGT